MPEKPELSEARRALLEKYLRGEISPVDTAKSAAQSNGKSSPAANSMPVEENDSLRVPVVPLRSSGSKRPFFYSHAHVDGGAFYCFTLADGLGSDQPFYILEPFRFEGGDIPPSMEALASAYIESLRTVQRHGPYLLGGFCGGGLIVYEMAQQLRKQGEDIDLLLLIESINGPGPATLSTFLRNLAGSFIRRFAKLLHISPQKALDWFLHMRHFYLLLRDPAYRKAHKPWLRPSAEMLHKDWIGLFVWLISDYEPDKYPGKVTYIWAKESHGWLREWRGKQREAVEREMIMIAGDHRSCRTDHLQTLADTLNRTISEVQTVEPH